MKKLIALLLILVLFVPSAFSESTAVGLSALSFDDLIALQKAIVAEIMSRPEWKEVEVPAGTWIIGEDIPAGFYCVRSGGIFSTTLKYYKTATATSWNYYTIPYDGKIGKIELTEGMKIELDTSATFAPPEGPAF